MKEGCGLEAERHRTIVSRCQPASVMQGPNVHGDVLLHTVFDFLEAVAAHACTSTLAVTAMLALLQQSISVCVSTESYNKMNKISSKTSDRSIFKRLRASTRQGARGSKHTSDRRKTWGRQARGETLPASPETWRFPRCRRYTSGCKCFFEHCSPARKRAKARRPIENAHMSDT